MRLIEHLFLHFVNIFFQRISNVFRNGHESRFFKGFCKGIREDGTDDGKQFFAVFRRVNEQKLDGKRVVLIVNIGGNRAVGSSRFAFFVGRRDREGLQRGLAGRRRGGQRDAVAGVEDGAYGVFVVCRFAGVFVKTGAREDEALEDDAAGIVVFRTDDALDARRSRNFV